jgi:methyl-accepting chemotaxis protein
MIQPTDTTATGSAAQPDTYLWVRAAQITHLLDMAGELGGEIAAASQEQALGVTQINAAMLQLSEGVQGSSQQSQELASTADELA